MHRSRPSILLEIALTVIVSTLAWPAAAEVESTQSETPPSHAQTLGDMSIEELMDLRVSGQSITGVHHTYDAGEWMVGYSFMYMDMDENLDGTRSVGTSGIFNDGFMVAPTWMDMQMHMFHLMFSPTDWLTLTSMMPYVRKSMDHLVNPSAPVPFAGERFTTRSEGPGDLKVSALLSLYRTEYHRFILDSGWSFPSGSIDEKDTTPMSMGSKARLPYPMQLGSGTFDFHPGATYSGQTENWGWGTHAHGIVRFGKNGNDYRLGNEWVATAWGSRELTCWLNTLLRLEGRGWGDIHGADPSLNTSTVPTADPNRRSGERLDILFGLNLFSLDGVLSGNRLALEGGLPIYQRLDGPQLQMGWRIQVSWDWIFDSPSSWVH